MVIYKYVLEVTDLQAVDMPDGATILSIAEQAGALCLWAMVDPRMPHEARLIEIIGTGNPIPTTPDKAVRRFIGTAVVPPFVWHVFERAVPVSVLMDSLGS